MTTDAPATPDQLEALFDEVSNWGRWGPDDEVGALNLITPEKRKAAAALVQDGTTVSLAQELPKRPGPNNPTPVTHTMVRGGDIAAGSRPDRVHSSADYFAIAHHGLATTHLDALCHVFHRDKMYNGYDRQLVTSIGALRNSIMSGKDGIVSRGVLLDIPALRGVDWLEPGEHIFPDELEAAEARQGLRVEPGDVLFVRTGRHGRIAALGDWPARDEGLAGLDHVCARYLRERDVAIVGSDGITDPLPMTVEGWLNPLHSILLVSMGVHLIDNAQLERIATACAERGRWEFLLAIGALRLEQGTGSPINPIAVF